MHLVPEQFPPHQQHRYTRRFELHLDVGLLHGGRHVHLELDVVLLLLYRVCLTVGVLSHDVSPRRARWGSSRLSPHTFACALCSRSCTHRSSTCTHTLSLASALSLALQLCVCSARKVVVGRRIDVLGIRHNTSLIQPVLVDHHDGLAEDGSSLLLWLDRRRLLLDAVELLLESFLSVLDREPVVRRDDALAVQRVVRLQIFLQFSVDDHPAHGALHQEDLQLVLLLRLQRRQPVTRNVLIVRNPVFIGVLVLEQVLLRVVSPHSVLNVPLVETVLLRHAEKQLHALLFLQLLPLEVLVQAPREAEDAPRDHEEEQPEHRLRRYR